MVELFLSFKCNIFWRNYAKNYRNNISIRCHGGT